MDLNPIWLCSYKEGTGCNECWVLQATDESLKFTSETNDNTKGRGGQLEPEALPEGELCRHRKYFIYKARSAYGYRQLGDRQGIEFPS